MSSFFALAVFLFLTGGVTETSEDFGLERLRRMDFIRRMTKFHVKMHHGGYTKTKSAIVFTVSPTLSAEREELTEALDDERPEEYPDEYDELPEE